MRLTKDKFLNLIKTAPDKMRAGSAVEKDALCRILFLTLHVDNEKVVSYLWREPFATMVKMGELQVGGGSWTNRTAASFLEMNFCESFCRRTSDLVSFARAKSTVAAQAQQSLTN